MNVCMPLVGGKSRWGHAVIRALPLLLVIASLVAAAVYGWVVHRGSEYRAYYSYVVALTEREAAPDFRFDGYYALQATDLFSETLAAWLRTPELVVAAHQQAGLPLPTTNPRQVARLVEATKAAPQLVTVMIRGSDSTTVEQLSHGMMKATAERVAMYHDQGVPALQFEVVPTEPWVGSQKLSAPVIVSAVWVFVLLFGINAVLIRESISATR